MLFKCTPFTQINFVFRFIYSFVIFSCMYSTLFCIVWSRCRLPPPPVRQNQLNHHAPAASPILKSLSGERRQDGPPAGFVYSKSTAHWVCLGVLARAFVPTCALAQLADPSLRFLEGCSVFACPRDPLAFERDGLCVPACLRECVCVCVYTSD